MSTKNEIVKKKQCQSNIEILRILSMFLVMLVHYLPLRMHTTTELMVNNPLKALFNLEMESIGVICVHCFILISGYFGIRWNRKSFFGLLFQILFWGLCGFVIAKYLLEPFLPSEMNYTISAFVSQMLVWYKGRWFISAYITLYILSPLANDFIQQSSEKRLLKFLIVFYIFSTLFGWVVRSQEFNTGLSAISLLGLYMLGAWLKRSQLRFIHWSKWWDLLSFFVCTLILTVASAALLLVGVKSSIYGYLNPIVIIESVFLFQFFRKIDVGTIGWVNFLSASAFSVFLFHCHPFAGHAYDAICRHFNSYAGGFIYVMIFLVVVFIISVLIDKIRVVIWNLLQKKI